MDLEKQSFKVIKIKQEHITILLGDRKYKLPFTHFPTLTFAFHSSFYAKLTACTAIASNLEYFGEYIFNLIVLVWT